MQNTDTLAGNLSKFIIYNTKTNKSVDLRGGISEFRYYENVLSGSITASAVFTDTGFKAGDNDKPVESVAILDSLPIRGGELVEVEFNDAKDNPTKLSMDLYVNRVKTVSPKTTSETYFIDLCTKEMLANEQSRVVERYDGKISENVKTILQKKLLVKKDIILDDTLIDYNFIGNDRKPFYICNWLASRSAPSGYGKPGSCAGYFFYETYEAFNFRSIDGLLSQNYKKKYLYNDTHETESGFEKVLSYNIDRNIDLQEKLVLGTYSNRSIFFDYYAMDYDVRNFSYDENQKDKVVHAGEDPINYISDEFRLPISRLMTHIKDVGTLPAGKTSVAQLKSWKSSPYNPTWDVEQIMVQSIMRYNQLFSVKINIVVAGDLSLRAGDIVWCKFPQVSGNPNTDQNERTSGLYMISSLCHRITPRDTFTSMTLVKDTFAKKPY